MIQMASMSVRLMPLLEANFLPNKKNPMQLKLLIKLKQGCISPPGLARPGYEAT